MSKDRRKKGFTILEMAVVVTIIAIIVGVVVISTNRARERTRDAVIISSLEQIQAIADTVYSPATGYKELAEMRDNDVHQIKDIRERIEDTGYGVKFNLNFPSDISGHQGDFSEYCAWVKLAIQNNNEPERNFCVDSNGSSLVVHWSFPDTVYYCRVVDVPMNCDYH